MKKIISIMVIVLILITSAPTVLASTELAKDTNDKKNILIETDLRTGEEKEIIVESSPDTSIRYTPSKQFITPSNQLIEGNSNYTLLGKPGALSTTAYVPTLCYLEVTFPNSNEPYVATGFIVGTHTIVTAGHCLYNTKYGGKATKVSVFPKRYSNKITHGPFETTKLAVPSKWQNNKDYNYDYGIITVNTNISEIVGGTMGYRASTDIELQNKTVRALGYQQSGKQYVSIGTITKVNAYTLETNAGTYSGESGGPVTLNKTLSNVIAEGINSRSDGNQAIAVRINKEIYDAISLYAKK